MSNPIKSALAQSAPWRKKIPWWLVLVEGIILLAIGIFILVQPARAGTVFVLLLGGFLLIDSLLRIFHGLYRQTQVAGTHLLMMRGGVGLATGILVVGSPFFTHINILAAGMILGVGLLLSGLIGLIDILQFRADRATSWGIVLADVVEILLAVIVFYEISVPQTSESTLQILGVIIVAAGVILTVYAVIFSRSAKPS